MSSRGPGGGFPLFRPREAAHSGLSAARHVFLLVEDQGNVRDGAAAFLKRQGCKVPVAANGGETFLPVEKRFEPVDLLLADGVMPDIDGRELAGRLRRLYPEIAVIFTSGYTERAIIRQADGGRDLDLIGKPFSRQAIVCEVRRVLDARARKRT